MMMQTKADERYKGVIFKNFAPFTDCINNINSTHMNNAKDIDVVMTMPNLTECIYNNSKASGSFLQ